MDLDFRLGPRPKVGRGHWTWTSDLDLDIVLVLDMDFGPDLWHVSNLDLGLDQDRDARGSH